MKKLLTLIFFSLSSAADIMTLDCSYPNYSDSTGKHKSKSEFSFKIVSDSKIDKVYMLGSQGSVELLKVPRLDGGVNYIEFTSVGNVMLTTVLPNGDSVHSRNSALLGEFLASQYYGSCKVI